MREGSTALFRFKSRCPLRDQRAKAILEVGGKEGTRQHGVQILVRRPQQASFRAFPLLRGQSEMGGEAFELQAGEVALLAVEGKSKFTDAPATNGLTRSAG